MHITRHSRVSGAQLDLLWALYERCYRFTAVEAVTREMLYRSEFEDAVLDPANRLWVLWEADQPVGMLMLATDVAATRYLSRGYLERRYPDKMAHGLVRYVLWVVVDGDRTSLADTIKLGRTAFALEAAEGSVVVFDVPATNYGTRGALPELARRVAQLVGDTTFREIEVQHYYALEFNRAQDASFDLASFPAHIDGRVHSQ